MINKYLGYLASLIFLLTTSCSHFVGESYQNGQTRSPSSAPVELNQPWSYDGGPDLDTAMGKELVDLVSHQPNMPGISKEITGGQKFRPAFGPTLWRMIQKPNSVKILFIGQDGTHIAEAAGRTATAGFGGRAQDMAYHFGVSTSAAFMNAYAFTIKGQYSAFGVPVISEENGVKKVSYDSVVDNGIWLMSQDQNSPMVQWRNKLIDWIIRNNKESLKLVVLFGGAAQDAIGTFIESRGGKVGTRYTIEQIQNKKIQVPFFESVSGGSNKEVPVALTKKNEDVFVKNGFKIQYSNFSSTIPERLTQAEAQFLEAKNYLSNNIATIYDDLAIPQGGIAGSGIIHPAQIGGYELDQIYINGKRTISLKDLKLSDGTLIKNDILVAEFPHPTSLSSNIATAASKVERSLELLKPYRTKGWAIETDAGLENKFALNQPYKYGRTDIPVDFYDFGTPRNRMVSVSSASRMTGNANIIVIGTRDKVDFDKNKLISATKALKPQGINPDEMYTARPRTVPDRYIYDAGPGMKMARIMKENIDLEVIGALKTDYKLKPGVVLKGRQTVADVADADGFNIKSHPQEVGDFGHYRGTFKDPRIVILADPDGVDDILTSRALTGTRGQYLQTLMNQMGVYDKYLVIKTVPFAMDGATEAEWKVVLSQTANYRKRVFEEVLRNPSIEMIITDGNYAALDIDQIANPNNLPIVKIKRTAPESDSGITAAGKAINKLGRYNKVSVVKEMSNIPRSHLGFFSRVWEGTSGTRVFDAISPADRGIAYAIVAPEWSYYQKYIVQSPAEKQAVQNLKSTLLDLKLPIAGETYLDYVKRIK